MTYIPFATDMLIFDTMVDNIQEVYLETDPHEYVNEGIYLHISNLLKMLHNLQNSKWYTVVLEKCIEFLEDSFENKDIKSLIEERMDIYKKIEPDCIEAVFFIRDRLFKKEIPDIFIPECGCGVPCDDVDP